MLPDTHFIPGELKYLCRGNSCRLLDARRTPGVVEAISSDGFFRWKITAFEDKGKYWDVPIEDVSRYQFARDSVVLTANEIQRLEVLITKFSEPLTIHNNPEDGFRTESRIQRQELWVAEWLSNKLKLSSARCGSDQGDFRLLLDEYMELNGLSQQERETAETHVLNPFSGEWMKGLAITCSELGLKSFSGTVSRTRTIFEGAGKKELRRKYIIYRLAFVRAAYRSLGISSVTLFRGMASEFEWKNHQTRCFSSWTFAEDVAKAFAFENEHARHSYFIKRTFPVEKLFLTYLETSAMSRQYDEKEALVIHDPRDEYLW